MPSYEVYLGNSDSSSSPETYKGGSVDPAKVKAREPWLNALRQLTQPLLDDKITPFVQQHYKGICSGRGGDGGRSSDMAVPGGHSRRCTPCHSLIRRYEEGARQRHATHQDGHALVTVVVSLSEYGADFTGGLYLATGNARSKREYLALGKGDALVHQADLFHGVNVLPCDTCGGGGAGGGGGGAAAASGGGGGDRHGGGARTATSKHQAKNTTRRWSWITWYRDSETCEDLSHEWFKECAEEGDPSCQFLHANKVGRAATAATAATNAAATAAASGGDAGKPKQQQQKQQKQQQERAAASAEIVRLNSAAAEGGHPGAAVKMARAWLKALPSALPYDLDEARRLFEKAANASHEPDAHYGLAALALGQLTLAHGNAHHLAAAIAPGAPAAADAAFTTSTSATPVTTAAVVSSIEGEPNNKDEVAHASALVLRQERAQLLREALLHLEAAARGGHAFAMFNLGIAHLYGLGTVKGRRDPDLAAEWFEASGLPEGFHARAMHARNAAAAKKDNADQKVDLAPDVAAAAVAGDATGGGGAASDVTSGGSAEHWEQRARALGFGAPWRQRARLIAGSGGNPGVDLNLPWPTNKHGQRPPEW
jgi:TPR repeat protein